MSDAIAARLKYNEALILKHLLRDKPNRADDWFALYREWEAGKGD